MIARNLIAPLAALSALTVGGALGTGAAIAAPKGGSVKGTVQLLAGKRAHPVKSEGFVKRKANPIKELKAYAPLSEMVVVLLDGPVADEDKVAPRHGAKWDLLGESFAFPLMPVQAGTAIDIKNAGRNKPQLYCPEQPDIVDPEPLVPGGVRSVRLKDPFKAVRIIDRDSVHLEGRIVAFPHPYFARIKKDKTFEIAGVPAGRWTLRIWFRDGWLEHTQKVNVQAKRATKAATIRLPAKLEPKAPGKAKTPDKKGS